MLEGPTFIAGESLPIAGPQSVPQTVEIDVGPWQRISVRFQAVKVSLSDEVGSVWYWQPGTVRRLNQ